MKGRIHLSSTILCYKIWFVKYRILVLFETLGSVVLILLVSISSENVGMLNIYYYYYEPMFRTTKLLFALHLWNELLALNFCLHALKRSNGLTLYLLVSLMPWGGYLEQRPDRVRRIKFIKGLQ